MKTTHPIILAALALSFALPSSAWACSAFLSETGGRLVVGKSYDWHMGQGMLVTNKRGVGKRAFALDPRQTPLEWDSKYGSLTFNQYGREMPNGGMNEAGLVVEVLWLDQSTYPSADARPALTELQWIQWALDRHGTVAALAEAAPKVRVSPVYARVHYFACDVTGACAAFEYLDQKLRISHGDDMPAPALTNHPYADSAAHLKQYQGFGGARPISPSRSSLARFVRAAVGVKEKGGDVAASTFSVLDGVSQGDYTVWNIVYLPAAREIQWRTRASAGVKRVVLSDFDFGCGSAVKVLNIDAREGGADAFYDYSRALNRALVDRGLSTMSSGLPPGVAALVAAYPDTTRCAVAK